MKKVLSLVLAFIMTFALIPFSAFAESADVCEFVSGSDGTLEYYVNGVKQSDLGLINLDGDYYYVNSNGVVVVGEYWVTKDNGFGYVGIQQFGTDGKMVVKDGIVAEDDGTLAYYIKNVKKSDLGLIELDGSYYYVNSSGVVVTGKYWVTKDNGLGYIGMQQFGSDGKMTVVEAKNGIITEDDGTLAYYVNNVKQSDLGLIELDGSYYYVNSNGVVVVGEYWVTKDNGLGYTGIQQFGTDGKMVLEVIADDEGTEGLVYTLSDDGTYYSVTGYTGEATDVVIPAVYEGLEVKAIGDNAFENCSSLTSVAISDSVTSIGSSAFYGCSGLTAVYIEDLEAWFEISFGNVSSNPLRYAGNLYVNGELITDLVIPESVTSIGDYAFYKCTSLTSVTIPDSVTEIGQNAFYGCSGLTAVYIEDLEAWCGIDFINSSNPLRYAKNLYLNGELVTDIVIPDSVTTIRCTFSGCTSLTSVTIPASVTSIGDSAFSGCTGLTSVTIPESVTSIGDFAFSGCTGLTSVTIPESVTSIGDFAFSGCTGLTFVTISASVTSIRQYAFEGCTGLTAVYIEDLEAWCKISFGDFSSNPLSYAKNLYLNDELVTDIVIPDSVTSIRCTFSGCANLTSVTIPDSVTSIGDYAFSGCSGLTSIMIPESVTSIGDYAFSGCDRLPSVKIPEPVISIGDYAFSGCTGLTSVTIPESVTSIGDHVFDGCSGLTSITIPDSVTSIGYRAFYKCTSLTSVTIPNSVTSIGDCAFLGCSGLVSVTISDSVTSIGDYVFYGCSSLTSITIPDSVTSIGDYVFYGCSSLTSITIPDSVTSIGDYAFYGCSGLVSVTIPEPVTLIGGYAFYRCSGLTSITIPDSVTSIGDYAFYGCSSLTSITIPDSVTSIGKYAFSYCTGMTDIYCEAAEKPWRWNSLWNTICYATVHWGYVPEAE